MATTRLSITAVPGRNYAAFLAKAPASGPHAGLFTELSVTATPGQRHNFDPKAPSGGVHTGEFTRLSVMATPGKRYVFLAKSPVIPVVPFLPEVGRPSSGSPDGALIRLAPRTYLDTRNLEEKDLIEIVQILLQTGILNQ